MRKETRYMRNSHNNVNSRDMNNSSNESGTQMGNARQVQIAHMDAKGLVYSGMFAFMVLLFMIVAGYISLQNQIQELKLEVIHLEQQAKPTPYVVHHENT